MTRIKICGITNLEDAQLAVKCGAWALGFVFYRKSPRYISPSKVKKIIEQLPPFVTSVGVFVDPKEGALRDICRFTGIHTIQLHGDEDPNLCRRLANFKIIKAFRVDENFDLKKVKPYQVDAYLFDTYQDDAFGGTGKTFNWDVVGAYTFDKPFILSGGLTAENVRAGIDKLKPFAVDVSSGVEASPGIKDHRKLKTFIDVVNFELRDK